MINKSKCAFTVAVALSSMASPAFAAGTVPHRHVYNFAQDRPAYDAYDYAPNPGVALPSGPVNKPSDPVNNPTSSGGGSMGFNKYMGHAH